MGNSQTRLLGRLCFWLTLFSVLSVVYSSASALPMALWRQGGKKDSKKDEKKSEPFKVERLTVSLGFYAMGPLSHDGRFLLFLAQKPEQAPNLYAMNLADHSIRRPLTSFKWGASDPVWSPDDKLIALAGVNDTGSFPEIYLLDIRDGKLRQLTKNEFTDKEPVFVSDGSRLLYASDESPLPDAAFGILHVASLAVSGGKSEYFTEDEVSSTHPGLERDGKTVLLIKISEASGRHSLWEYSLTGKPQRDLTGTKFARIHRYICSSDGNSIILWAQEEAERQDQIYVLEIKTLQVRELPEPDLPKRTPALSPDGKRIAFSGLAGNGTQIFLYDLTTGELKQLTYKGSSNHSPVFASNTLLLFGSDRDKERDLYQMDLSAPPPEPSKK